LALLLLKIMQQYLQLLDTILSTGNLKSDRTGSGTQSIFGYQMRFDLNQGFPLVTTKKVYLKAIIYELLWFLNGDTNIRYLQKRGVKIWDAWADENGDLGAVYGAQWRSWLAPDGTQIDQLSQLLRQLRETPNSRRMLVSAWNVADLPDETISPQANVFQGKMALAACHTLFQFYVTDGKLSCQLYQRSCDSFLGLPFNIASYALLTQMIAQQTGLELGEFIWTGGDVHIYSNHVEQVKLQLQRQPRTLPSMLINNKADSLFNYQYEDFNLINYNPYPAIKAPISI